MMRTEKYFLKTRISSNNKISENLVNGKTYHKLLHGHAFREVSRLIHVASAHDGDVVAQ